VLALGPEVAPVLEGRGGELVLALHRVVSVAEIALVLGRAASIETALGCVAHRALPTLPVTGWATAGRAVGLENLSSGCPMGTSSGRAFGTPLACAAISD
jgi:hypothetical protein